jgi:hypothetical protein
MFVSANGIFIESYLYFSNRTVATYIPFAFQVARQFLYEFCRFSLFAHLLVLVLFLKWADGRSQLYVPLVVLLNARCTK